MKGFPGSSNIFKTPAFENLLIASCSENSKVNKMQSTPLMPSRSLLFDANEIPKPRNLDDLILFLRNELNGSILGSKKVDPDRIVQLMTNYSSSTGDWEKYAHFDSKNYTRNLVDSGDGNFNLLVLAWGPGQASPIHDHAGSHCIMKMLDGELQETLYSWPDESKENSPLIPSRTKTFMTNEVAYVHDRIGLHRMANVSSQNALSLHLYTPPISHASVFQEATGQSNTPASALFYSINGRLSEK